MIEPTVYCPPKQKGLHLDPRTKILFMGVLTSLMFYAHEDLLFVSVAAIVPCFLLTSNKRWKTAVIYGGLFMLAILFKLTQSMFSFPGVLNSIGIMLIALVLRMFPIFMLGYYIIYSTKVSEFVCAMHKWHVPESFIIPISVVFRFVPTIGEESKAISYAMKMREINFGTKKFWKNPTAFLEYRIIPLMMSIAKIGEELSAAALTKGLDSCNCRSSIAKIGFGFYDFMMYFIAVSMIIWVII